MTCPQMVCHLTDSFHVALGERLVGMSKAPAIPRFMFKWLALNLPMEWPKGVATMPEVDQTIGGTPPAEFGADRAELLRMLDRFVAHPGPWGPHAIFGGMTGADWMRWGYLHADHHLRQFGR
jgi:hypothetical protein